MQISRQSDQICFRVPDGMRDLIRERAAENRRSMNAQIVHYLECALAHQNENGPAEAATSPSHVNENPQGNPMNSNTNSTARHPAASGEQSDANAETASLLDVIDRLCRAGYFADIVSMAVDGMSDKRVQCAFAATLQSIIDELSEAKRELYVIALGEGGAA